MERPELTVDQQAMTAPSRVQLLTAVQAFLGDGLARERVAEVLNELEGVRAPLLRDLGLTTDTQTLSLRITAFGPNHATVQVQRRLFPHGRWQPDTATTQDLAIDATYDGRWKIVDLELDGAPLAPRIRPAVVEPAETEDLRVRAVAVLGTPGKTSVTVSVRNTGSKRCRLQCAGSDWRWGPLRLLVQAGRRRLRGHGGVDYEPDSEHAFALQVPARAGRVWVKLREGRSPRALLFAVSWDPTQVERREPWRPHVRRGLLPYAGFAAFVGYLAARKGLVPALGCAALIPLLVVHTDLCVRRLERKLTRLRRSYSA
jgi:hypothetical protein